MRSYWISHMAPDGGAISTLSIIIPRPQHNTSIFSRTLNGWKHIGKKISRRNEAAPWSLWRSWQPQEYLVSRNTWNPLLPCIFKVTNCPRSVLARRVVVELHPNIVKKTCSESISYPSIRKWTLRSCSYVHLLALLGLWVPF